MTSPNPERHQRGRQWEEDWPVSRRRILKTGALASGTGVIVGTTDTAGARSDGNDGNQPPVRVIDSDDPNPDPAIVILGTDVPITDWIVFGSETVADQNPEYDSEDVTVIVAFEHLLDSGWPNWRRAKPDILFDGVVDRGIKFHAFPGTRLEKHRSTGRKRPEKPPQRRSGDRR